MAQDGTTNATPSTPVGTADVANASALVESVSVIRQALSSGSDAVVAAVTAIATAVTQKLVGGVVGTTTNRLLRSKTVSSGSSAGSLQGSVVSLDNLGNMSGILGLSTTGLTSPLNFGAAGNGSTNDRQAWQDAIDSTATPLIIDGEGLTYRIDTALNLRSNVWIRNCTIDFTNAANSAHLFQCSGSYGSSLAFTAATRGAATITVSNASGIAADTVLLLRSNDVSKDNDYKSPQPSWYDVASTIECPEMAEEQPHQGISERSSQGCGKDPGHPCLGKSVRYQ